MNDNIGLGFFVAGVLCLVVLMFGPTFTRVNKEQWDRAEVACAAVGGVEAVEPYDWGRYEVFCSNGMRIKLGRSN